MMLSSRIRTVRKERCREALQWAQRLPQFRLWCYLRTMSTVYGMHSWKTAAQSYKQSETASSPSEPRIPTGCWSWTSAMSCIPLVTPHPTILNIYSPLRVLGLTAPLNYGSTPPIYDKSAPFSTLLTESNMKGTAVSQVASLRPATDV